jgi:hypothetical protein
MAYRLNLYCNGMLTGTELLHASLADAKELATAALESEHAHRAELVNKSGSILFQRWAVL